MNHLFKQLFKSQMCRNLSSFNIKGIHEPKYLDYLKPQIPYYPLINVQVITH